MFVNMHCIDCGRRIFISRSLCCRKCKKESVYCRSTCDFKDICKGFDPDPIIEEREEQEALERKMELEEFKKSLQTK